MQKNLIRSLIFGMKERFDARAAADADIVFQFEIAGDEGGDFVVAVRNGECDVREARDANPTLVLSMTAPTYVDLALGRITGPQAFFKRKIRMSGDINYALKLHTLFPSIKNAAV